MDPALRNWMNQRTQELKVGTFDADKNLLLSHEEVKQI